MQTDIFSSLPIFQEIPLWARLVKGRSVAHWRYVGTLIRGAEGQARLDYAPEAGVLAPVWECAPRVRGQVNTHRGIICFAVNRGGAMEEIARCHLTHEVARHVREHCRRTGRPVVRRRKGTHWLHGFGLGWLRSSWPKVA